MLIHELYNKSPLKLEVPLKRLALIMRRTIQIKNILLTPSKKQISKTYEVPHVMFS